MAINQEKLLVRQSFTLYHRVLSKYADSYHYLSIDNRERQKLIIHKLWLRYGRRLDKYGLSLIDCQDLHIKN